MMSMVLELGEWCLFFLVLLAYVRWVLLEREFFTGIDPENWHPTHASQKAPSAGEAPLLGLRLPLLTAPGNPS